MIGVEAKIVGAGYVRIGNERDDLGPNRIPTILRDDPLSLQHSY